MIALRAALYSCASRAQVIGERPKLGECRTLVRLIARAAIDARNLGSEFRRAHSGERFS